MLRNRLLGKRRARRRFEGHTLPLWRLLRYDRLSCGRDDPSRAGRDVLAECIGGIDVERGAAGVLNRVFGLKLVKLLMTPQLGPRSASWPGASARSVTQASDQKCPANNDTSRKRSLLEFRNDIAEYRRNIAGAELLHCRELLLQSGQLIAKAKIFCVPTAVFGRAGLLDLALMKRTPRAQMG